MQLCLICKRTPLRYIEEKANGKRVPKKRGPKRLISDDVIKNATLAAEVNDASKDSATSTATILASIDTFRRNEQSNPLASPKAVSKSTSMRAVNRIAPVQVKSGGVQYTSRQKALLDPRNAISRAATWTAVTMGVVDPRQIHSWDELSIELNGFGKKLPLRLNAVGAKLLKKRNLTPATTSNQGQKGHSRLASVSSI